MSHSYVLHRDLAGKPETIVRAKGSYLYLAPSQGVGERAILDACGGAAVACIGHGKSEVIEAMTSQLEALHYCHSGAFTTDKVEELAELLCKGGDFDKCFFASGGSEAVESAIKLARQYHLERGAPTRTHFIGRKGSYHGNLLGALSLGGHAARREPFLPLFSDKFHQVSACYSYREQEKGESDAVYIQRLANELEQKILDIGVENVAAFVAEPVVGAATGCVPWVPGYFQAMREVCDRYEVLLIMDEVSSTTTMAWRTGLADPLRSCVLHKVMCGMGRTGKLHAWQHFGVQPDIQVVAKGLSGGYAPCSAVLATSKITKVLQDGTGRFNNGFTFQNWTIGAVAALAVQKYIINHDLVNSACIKGRFLEAQIRQSLQDHPCVGDIRGQGLFWGIEFVQDRESKTPFPRFARASELIFQNAKSLGVMVYPGTGTVDGTTGDHILVAPPFDIQNDEITLIARVLRKAVDEFASSLL